MGAVSFELKGHPNGCEHSRFRDFKCEIWPRMWVTGVECNGCREVWLFREPQGGGQLTLTPVKVDLNERRIYEEVDMPTAA